MRRWHWALVIAAAAAAGALWYFQFYHGRVQAAANNRLRTATVTRGSLEVTVPGSGTFAPAAEQKVFAPLAGKVVRVLEAGTRVAEGEPVVWLDDTELRRAVEEAERALKAAEFGLEEARLTARSQEQQAAQDLAAARSSLRTAQVNLEAARADFERAKSLYEAQAVARAEMEAKEQALRKAEIAYEEAEQKLRELGARQKIEAAQVELKQRQAELNLEKARADLARARADLAQATVRAPLAGVVGSVEVEPGQNVAVNAPLFTVMDTTNMVVSLQVDEVDVAQVKEGQEVELSVEAFPDQIFRGRVLRVAPQAVQQNNISIFNVEVEVANRDGRLRPGMTADGDILVMREENALLVPLAAVQRRQGKPVVLVMENGRPRPVPVELGPDDGVNAVIKAGLEEGATVALSPAQGQVQSQGGQRAGGWPMAPPGAVFGPGRSR